MPTSDTVIPCNSARIDLENWLFTMTDGDYQGASRQHQAMGTFVENGVRGMVNVEVLGHALVIQHYLEVTARNSYVEMYSPKSRAYLMHVFPVEIGVRWTMEVKPGDDGDSVFSCTVETEMSRLLQVLARLTGVTSAIRRHTKEETYGYAADIERKLGLAPSQPGFGGSPMR